MVVGCIRDDKEIKMIKLKKLIKESLTWNNRKFGERLPTMADYKKAHNEGKLNEAGIKKSYKAIMKLEREIDGLEKIFRREKSGITRDRARKMEKSIKFRK